MRHPKSPGGAQGWRVTSTTPTLFSQRAEPSPLWSNASPSFLRAIEASVMGEGEGGGGGDGGARGEFSPVGGSKGRSPRQPQCMTLGRLAPRHYAVRRRPRCPASHGAPAPAEHLFRYRNRAEDPLPPLPGNATPWRVPIPDGEVLSQPPPLLQGCGSNSDGIESGSDESSPWFGTSD